MNKFFKEIINNVLYLLLVLLSSYLLITFIGQRTVVDGHSMENTLQNGDNLIVDKISYRFKDPERFDVIVFPHYDNSGEKFYIKRVIGLPGEKVFIDSNGNIYINDIVLREHYGKERIQNAGLASDVLELGPNEYFVLGDNRNNSSDSREPTVGLVNKNKIIGKAWVRIFPLNKFGFVSSIN